MELEQMPTLTVPAPDDRAWIPANPFATQAKIHERLGAIYRLRVEINRDDGDTTVVESVWINDEVMASEILLGTARTVDGGVTSSSQWRKGPQTFEPFLSLVPMHIIGLEGEEHAVMRRAAQRALNNQLQERLVGITVRKAKELVTRLRGIAAGELTSWIGTRDSGSSSVLIEQVDRRVRAYSLDIISSALFSQEWGALNDYSESNAKAYALGQVMYELHWRVADAKYQDWKKNIRFGASDKLLSVLETFIETEIEKRQKDKEYAQLCSEDMLSEWISDESQKLSKTQIRNLCLTFLTMGHENVATSIAWTIILLAENQDVQEVCREEALSKQEWTASNLASMKRTTDAYHEATRLYPSVPSLTRVATVDTLIGGYKIPSGTEFIVNTFLVHRNKKTWGEHASSFIPSRFDQAGGKCPMIATTGPPDAFPFGVGERSCLGRFLGYLEVRCFIGEILKNFVVSKVEPKSDLVAPFNMVSLRPEPHTLRFTSILKSKM